MAILVPDGSYEIEAPSDPLGSCQGLPPLRPALEQEPCGKETALAATLERLTFSIYKMLEQFLCLFGKLKTRL